NSNADRCDCRCRMPSDHIPASYLTAALLTSLSSAGVLVGSLTRLYRRSQEQGAGLGGCAPLRDSLATWLVAWLFYSFWLVFKILVPLASTSGWVFSVEQCLIGSAAVFLLTGSLRLVGSPISSTLTLVLLASAYSWACAGESILENVKWAEAAVFLVL